MQWFLCYVYSMLSWQAELRISRAIWPTASSRLPEISITWEQRLKKNQRQCIYADVTSLWIPVVFSWCAKKQCCGSGSALIWLSWIRIRIGNADPDPGAWKFTKINKNLVFLPFKKALYLMFFWPINYLKYMFYVKIQLFVTSNSDQDPDPDQHESALVQLPGSGSGSALR